jgi:hypothetical protein
LACHRLAAHRLLGITQDLDRRLDPARLLVGLLAPSLKPSEDGKAVLLRLFGASGKAVKATLRWAEPAPKGVSLSDRSERPGAAVTGPIDVPAWSIVTLRAELPWQQPAGNGRLSAATWQTMFRAGHKTGTCRIPRGPFSPRPALW